MQKFTDLFIQLDQTTKTNEKVEALANYFACTDDQDRLWTIALLSHRRPRRTVPTTQLRKWAAELADLPQWLFEESYSVVGDLAETIALVLPSPKLKSDQSLTYWINYIKELNGLNDEEKKAKVWQAWQQLNSIERFIFNKMITGGFRVGVSQKLMTRALSQYTGIEENVLAHRLMGNWSPEKDDFQNLIIESNPLDDISRPYPFYLAYSLDTDIKNLGSPKDWLAERKWDGIRGQVIIREDTLFVWSRGEELLTNKFPEYAPLAEMLPNGTVLDGEILPFKAGVPLTFKDLQTRIGRKNVTKKVMEKAPVIFMAYDLTEWNGKDVRQKKLSKRRSLLEKLIADLPSNDIIHLSEHLNFSSWASLAKIQKDSRKYHSEGVMIKRKSSVYQSGRKKGDWWKWKVDPLIIDAVMIYAQRGHGRRANLFSDFTFAVWDEDKLVPIAKAYSGLTDHEFREITTWVNKNTVERFGPVRSVKPVHVFEIAFEGINASSRHKSGVALRFPRIHRWRKNKPVKEANTLADLKGLLDFYEG